MSGKTYDCSKCGAAFGMAGDLMTDEDFGVDEFCQEQVRSHEAGECVAARPGAAETVPAELSEEAPARLMSQVAPWPHALVGLVNQLQYKPGWTFYLGHEDRGQGSVGLTFTVICQVVDSYHPDMVKRVAHLFPVPPAAFDVRSWQRWLLEQLLLVERHEACEFFRLGADGTAQQVRPYAPSHGPGNDPYLIREVGTVLDVRTSFRGEVNP